MARPNPPSPISITAFAVNPITPSSITQLRKHCKLHPFDASRLYKYRSRRPSLLPQLTLTSSTKQQPLCKMMRAAQVSHFGNPDDILTVSDSVSRPTLTKSGTMLVKVHAVSLSPSDYRMTSGTASLFKPPKDTVWPYIPCGDLSGIVEQVMPDEERFKVGDEVVCTWNEYGMGGLAEYAIVDTKLSEAKPPEVTFLEAAALADSPVNAMFAVEDAKIGKGDRVLVLGGSGAMGTHVIQLAKARGAEFVAATSTDEKLCKELGADVVINYREKNWWEEEEFRKNPFDVVIDCAEGKVAWERAQKFKMIKCGRKGGRWQAVVQNEWDMTIKTWPALIAWGWPIFVRTMTSKVLPWKPRYMMHFPVPRDDSLARFLGVLRETGIKIVMDPKSPWEFTTEGVRGAFNLLISRRAHGKIVIQICE